MTLSAHETHRLKQAPRTEGVLPVVLERWSPRAFDSREVSLADLRKVFEAARWAPSSYNEQPWRFIVGRRGTQTHDKIVSALGGFNQVWAPKAPVLILGTARKNFSHNDAPNGYAVFDLGAASALITIQAAALGLTTHQMAGFDQEAARKALEIPETFAIGSVMALGYQGEPSALEDERLIAQEIAPRTRKPLSEIILGAWGEPANLG
jgi:nitroreductase